jgi:transmembrane sensor
MGNPDTYSFDERLVVKYLSGELNDEEKAIVQEKLGTSEKFRASYFEMREIFDITGNETLAKKINLNKAIERFKQRTSKEEKSYPKITIKKLTIHFVRIAAAILIGALIWKFLIEKEKIDVFSGNQVLYDLKLPDGSYVDLNKNTKFQYFKKFRNSKREVFLTGEAYFRIQKMPSCPFIVNVGDLVIKVLGTSFNIKAYPDKKEIRVTVNSGKVIVSLKNDPDKKIVLNQNDKGNYFSKTRILTKDINTNLNYNSWETNVLTFNATKLIDAIGLLQQQFGTKISIPNKALGNCKITATFDHQTLDAILKMLELSFDIKVIRKDSIILNGEGCQ